MKKAVFLFYFLMLFSTTKILTTSSFEIESNIRTAMEHWYAYFNDNTSIHNNHLRCNFSIHDRPAINVTNFSLTESQILPILDELSSQLSGFTLNWWLTPSNTAPRISHLFEESGFEPYLFKAMKLDLQDFKAETNNTELTVVECKNTDEIKSWITFVTQIFGYDNACITTYLQAINNDMLEKKIIRYVVYQEDHIIAAGALYIDQEFGGIYKLAVDPAFRRKGIATMLINLFLQKAQNLGLNYVVLLSHYKFVDLYQKIGFEPLFDITIYSKDFD